MGGSGLEGRAAGVQGAALRQMRLLPQRGTPANRHGEGAMPVRCVLNPSDDALHSIFDWMCDLGSQPLSPLVARRPF